MRIDRPIGNELLNKPCSCNENGNREAAPQVAPEKLSQSVEVISQHKTTIDAAMASSDVNMQAIEEARKALADGSLDTPEAAMEAAGNILDFGF